VARLLADENFPLPVVEALRIHVHDVVTMADLKRAGQRCPMRRFWLWHTPNSGPY